METKANYPLVGACVIFFFCGILGFGIWVSKATWSQKYTWYDIFFSGSVTGLKEGCTVRYRGVPVGVVEKVEISANNVEHIRALVKIEQKVAIKTDTLAVIEMQGLAGGIYIQLQGGTQDAAILKKTAHHPSPVIMSKPSTLEAVADTLPELIQSISILINDFKRLLSSHNAQNIQTILENLRDISQTLNGKENGLWPALMKSELGVSFLKTTAHLGASLDKIDAVVLTLHGILKACDQPLQDFSVQGLTYMNRFLNEGAESFQAIRRLSESLERSPARFLHNDTKEGYRP